METQRDESSDRFALGNTDCPYLPSSFLATIECWGMLLEKGCTALSCQPELRAWGVKTATFRGTAQNSRLCPGWVTRGCGLESPYGRSGGNLASKPVFLPLDSPLPYSKYAWRQNGPLNLRPGLQLQPTGASPRRTADRALSRTAGQSPVASNKRRNRGSRTRATLWTNLSVCNPGARTVRPPVFIRYTGMRAHKSAPELVAHSSHSHERPHCLWSERPKGTIL